MYVVHPLLQSDYVLPGAVSFHQYRFTIQIAYLEINSCGRFCVYKWIFTISGVPDILFAGVQSVFLKNILTLLGQ